MANNVLRTAFEQLTHDAWRDSVPFSSEVLDAHAAMFSATSEGAAAERLLQFIQKHQPCLFGRIAARESAIRVCVITEADLTSGDEHVRDKIQAARLEWRQQAELGLTSNFVIHVLSSRIAEAIPDRHMLAFAARIASLYLLQDEIKPDEIYLERVAIEIPTPTPRRSSRFEWNAGVNYFNAQGDGRWWQDHRIPGGMAFSTNSVGHMVRSHGMARTYELLSTDIDDAARVPKQVVDSLSNAVVMAMRTIQGASSPESGKATWLLEGNPSPKTQCPALPPNLAGKNHEQYCGYYDTDATLPSLYFRPDVTRPSDAAVLQLDFTYLQDKNVDNADFRTTAEGLRTASAHDRNSGSDDDGGFRPA